MNATENIKTLFHKVLITLLGLFEIYHADGELIEHAAEEMENIYRDFFGKSPVKPSIQGKLRMERLLDELESDEKSFIN